MVGGMMVIELLAGTMRLDRGRIAAVEDDIRQTYTVKHIWKGPFCFFGRLSRPYAESLF